MKKKLLILFVCPRTLNHDVCLCLSVTVAEQLRMRDVQSWKPDDEEEAPSGGGGGKSADGVASVQNPLGSSIGIPHDS